MAARLIDIRFQVTISSVENTHFSILHYSDVFPEKWPIIVGIITTAEQLIGLPVTLIQKTPQREK